MISISQEWMWQDQKLWMKFRPQVEIHGLDIPYDDPAPIEVVPAQAVPTSVLITPPLAPELRRSTRVIAQVTQVYALSIAGSTQSYVVTQLESQGVQTPDGHMFVQDDFYQAAPGVV
jgi:hypothetical protein